MPRQPIYLDYAAATPLDSSVAEAIKPFYSQLFHNPSANYLAAKKVRQALDDARSKVAHWLGARPSEVIFTAGGTEANNLAVHGILRKFPDANVVVSAVEHESVLAPAHEYDCREVVVDSTGRLILEDLRKKIDDKTVLVSIMYANNEVGTIQPLREVSQVISSVRSERQKSGNSLPIYLHTDACQAANYLDLHVARLGVDLMTLNGGKIYGPKQTGALYVKGGVELRSVVSGGGHERGLRSGTENVTGIIGLATALEAAQTMRHQEAERLNDLQQTFIRLIRAKISDAEINGSLKKRLPNNVHVMFPGCDGERLLIQLDEVGVMAAAGSACSASNEESSHVLRAMGLSDDEARASLRFSMGRQTTEADVLAAAKALAELRETS